MAEKRKYRLTLCHMVFSELEVEEESAYLAQAAGIKRAGAARFTYRAGPVVHRVERMVPAEKPGEFVWEQIRG